MGHGHEPQQRLVLPLRRLLRRVDLLHQRDLRRAVEYSEPETRNEGWVLDTFPNIKFSNNIHSYGGYFMWAPGAYKNDGFRTTSPAPNIGIEKYFFDAGENILKRIKESRGTVILPERTGPIADVLYSAAGNSADDAWYRKGVISYSFETGADRMLSTTTGTAATTVGFQPCFAGVGTGGGQGACPASGALSNEGRDEALEFAAGNFGLVESAYAYGKDVTPPVADLDADGVTQSKSPINYRFNMTSEPSVIHYTTDGSTPTLSSPTYEAQRARSVGQVLTISTPGQHGQVACGGHQGQRLRGPVEVLPARHGRSDHHGEHRRRRGLHAGPARPAHVLVRG